MWLILNVLRKYHVLVSCDLSAGRKVYGFLGHSAHSGCSRCLKKFSGTVGNIYSEFNRNEWKPRSTEEHRKVALNLHGKTTRAAVDQTESATGYHDTVLLKLPGLKC